MQKRLISFIKYAFFLGLGIFLVWWSIHKMSAKDYNEFVNALKTANYYLLIPVFFYFNCKPYQQGFPLENPDEFNGIQS